MQLELENIVGLRVGFGTVEAAVGAAVGAVLHTGGQTASTASL